jgi:copper resistance protein B
MPQPPQPAADPHAGHQMPPPQASDQHAGHDMPGHAAAPAAPPVGPPPATAFAGPEHAAEALFGAQAMRSAREEMLRMHGRMATHRFRLDRLEVGTGGEGETYAWDADFFYGEPLDRLWIKSEGEGGFGGELEHGEVQALWSHALTPFFDLQAGLRYDFAPDPQRGHLVLGLQGLAPYWIEVDAAAFLSDEGDLTARLEVEYDLRITQRLILQPRVEVDLSAQDVPELRIGSGLTSAEAGIRLRYEIVPEFAPYVGVQYERAFGRTADFREARGEDAGALTLLAGLRIWF